MGTTLTWLDPGDLVRHSDTSTYELVSTATNHSPELEADIYGSNPELERIKTIEYLNRLAKYIARLCTKYLAVNTGEVPLHQRLL